MPLQVRALGERLAAHQTPEILLAAALVPAKRLISQLVHGSRETYLRLSRT